MHLLWHHRTSVSFTSHHNFFLSSCISLRSSAMPPTTVFNHLYRFASTSSFIYLVPLIVVIINRSCFLSSHHLLHCRQYLYLRLLQIKIYYLLTTLLQIEVRRFILILSSSSTFPFLFYFLLTFYCRCFCNIDSNLSQVNMIYWLYSNKISSLWIYLLISI